MHWAQCAQFSSTSDISATDKYRVSHSTFHIILIRTSFGVLSAIILWSYALQIIVNPPNNIYVVISQLFISLSRLGSLCLGACRATKHLLGVLKLETPILHSWGKVITLSEPLGTINKFSVHTSVTAVQTMSVCLIRQLAGAGLDT